MSHQGECEHTYSTDFLPKKSSYDILEENLNTTVQTIPIVCSNGSLIYVAYRRNCVNNSQYIKNITFLMYCSDTYMRCRTCVYGFLKNFVPFQFENKETILDNVPCSNEVLAHIRRLNDYFQDNGVFQIIDGRIGTVESDGYPHLYIDLPSCILTKYTVDDYNWFINQHYSTLERLMKENCQKGIIESLDLLLDIIPRVTYGDKIKSSTEWFRKYMEIYMNTKNQFKKKIVVLDALLNQYMTDGYGEERIVATNLKQTKDTILQLLSCAHNEKALVSMLTNLFDPSTYMRRTAEPSEGSLTVAMKIFQDSGFYTTIMTVDNLLSKYNGKAPSSQTVGDAFSTWGSMRTSLQDSRIKGKRGGASGFASRAQKTCFPTTMTELYERFDEFPGIKINVQYSSYPVMLTEYPESSKDLFKHDFLWAFQNRSHPNIYNISYKFNDVTCMTKPGTMGRNVFFGIKNAIITSKIGNTCFPTFLKEGVQRKAGKAFESLNKTTNARIPSGNHQLALGIGASRSGYNGALLSSLTFMYDGHKFTISKM